MFKCKLYDRKNAITNVISNNKNSYTSINYYGSKKYFYCGKNPIDTKQSQEMIAWKIALWKMYLACEFLLGMPAGLITMGTKHACNLRNIASEWFLVQTAEKDVLVLKSKKS